MAISQLCGFESGSSVGEFTNAAGVTISTSVVHSGARSARLNAAGLATWFRLAYLDGSGVAQAIYKSCRFYLQIGTLPTTNIFLATIQAIDGGTANARLWLDSDGKLTIGQGATRQTTSTNALSADSTWHLIEFDVGWSSGNGKRVYVDGVEWASNTSDTPTAQVELAMGQRGTAWTGDVYIDDLEIHDSSLPAGDIGDETHILWMPVVSDNNRNNWTGGAGGTTNLFDALDNVPPVGVAAGSDTDTSQIQTATNPGTAYDGNVQDYTTAGLTASDTIRAVMPLAIHGEGVATGSKTGDITIVSNPSSGSSRTFEYGTDLGAIGTFPSVWDPTPGPVTESPPVTLGTSPVVRVRKTDTGTREAHVCWLGIYVAYTPSAGPPPTAPPPFQRQWRRLRRKVIA